MVLHVFHTWTFALKVDDSREWGFERAFESEKEGETGVRGVNWILHFKMPLNFDFHSSVQCRWLSWNELHTLFNNWLDWLLFYSRVTRLSELLSHEGCSGRVCHFFPAFFLTWCAVARARETVVGWRVANSGWTGPVTWTKKSRKSHYDGPFQVASQVQGRAHEGMKYAM